MPDTRPKIELMDIFADGVCFAALNQPDRGVDLIKILTRIYAYQSTGRAIFLARISGFFRTRRVESRVFAEVAFDGEQIFRLRHRSGNFVFTK